MAEAVRTVFIGNLPPDSTERELWLLFYSTGGCENIKIYPPAPGADPSTRRGRTSAFVQFASPEAAAQAVGWVNGMQFFPHQTTWTLHCEMAKQDMTSPVMGMEHGPRVGTKRQHQQLLHGMPPPQPGGLLGGTSTVFVGGLNEMVSSGEFEQFARSCSGFVQAKMKDEGTPRCTGFAQYQTPEHALAALQRLPLVPLPSLRGRAPNCELARSNISQPFGGGGGFPRNMIAAGPAGNGVNHLGPVGVDSGSSTVFFGNLSAQVTEEEITAFAMSAPEFARIKCKGIGAARATAWAQYMAPEAARHACALLRNRLLASMGKPPNVELANQDLRDLSSSHTGGVNAFYMQQQQQQHHHQQQLQLHLQQQSLQQQRYGGGLGGGGEQPSSTVFLGNIEASVTQQDVEAFCRQAPGFERVTTKGLGQGRAVAWAVFSSPHLAEAAVEQFRLMPLHPMLSPPNVELARKNSRTTA